MKLFSFIAAIIFVGSNCCFASVVYVSSSMGSNLNRGVSEDRPLKTIAAALSKADTVFLKSGDVFFENIIIRRGMISKYGGKELPVISGYKRIIEPRWKPVGDNLWKLRLAESNFTGNVVEGASLQNNIGCIREYDKDQIHGRKYQYLIQLSEDWDMWQTENHAPGLYQASDFDNLYLYLHQDPNKLHLEVSTSSTAVVISNATIENVRIEGWGFGVSAGERTIIRNCEIDAIGGKTQVGNTGYVCFGNGIEFWIRPGLADCLVEGCKISRCYDCACSIQGRDKTTPTNIIFRNNIIIDCCQAWEDFFTNDAKEAVFENCVFENNVVVNSGNTTGFGYTKGRSKYCHVLGNNYLGNKGMIIRNNVFVGGNYYCAAKYDGGFKSNAWEGNTCYIKRGEWLLRCINKGDEMIKIPVDKGKFRTLKAATDDAIRRYRELTGDETTRFVIKSDGNINRRVKKLKQQYSKR